MTVLTSCQDKGFSVHFRVFVAKGVVEDWSMNSVALSDMRWNMTLQDCQWRRGGAEPTKIPKFDSLVMASYKSERKRAEYIRMHRYKISMIAPHMEWDSAPCCTYQLERHALVLDPKGQNGVEHAPRSIQQQYDENENHEWQ